MYPTQSVLLDGDQWRRLSDERRRHLSAQWGRRAPRLSEAAVAARGLRLAPPWRRGRRAVTTC